LERKEMRERSNGGRNRSRVRDGGRI
jgi:hypothetical protein